MYFASSGLVEQTTNKLILFPVNDRSADTLMLIIVLHVKKGTRIFTDGWSSYGTLNERRFDYFTVIHKDRFSATYRNAATGETIKVRIT